MTNLILLILSAVCSTPALSAPQAHWAAEDQIKVFMPLLRSNDSLRFDLVTERGSLRKALKTLDRQGDFLTLSMQPPIPNLHQWIKKPLWIKATDQKSKVVFQTAVRLTGLLDERFADPSEPTGLIWKNGSPSFSVWTPSAQKVELLLFDDSSDSSAAVFPMKENQHGFWMLTGKPEWKDKFYQYRVTIFSPITNRMESHEVADPASISLSTDSGRSQIVDVNDPRLMPVGWQTLKKPPLEKVTDSVVYELHLRDYTTMNAGVPAELQGKYTGIVHPGSQVLQHFKDLATAGLTHVHFLPLMDFAGVPEIATRASRLLDWPADVPADSPIPQEKIGTNRNRDAYNWGYNPVQWMTPEGSYSTNPDGAARIYEMRQMIQGMNEAGLRVVLDVVFNHTYASGIEDYSVFDRVVPGYYHRYNDRGELMKSSCCADVATENVMVEKLIIDSLVFLATTYKLDGFRFDLMNLHTREQADKIYHVLKNMTTSGSGVDGSKFLIFAEAWPFGSLEELKPGTSFFQLRSHGSGIGVFNDRMRDALRGGTTSSKEKSDQGFATGLFWDFNQEPANTNTPIDSASQKEKLLFLGDIVKIGLSGNLRDYPIRDRRNNMVVSGQMNFRGVPVAYAAEPAETISYVSAHDGYALWDAVQAKLPFSTPGRNPVPASIEERVRTQKLLLATVALSQGIPFFEGGSELLRSKSGDVDSYDSSDWFNRVDLSFNTNNWGVGLPPLWRNEGDWSFWQPRLVHPSLKAGKNEILSSRDYFKALLKLRRSSPLLRLSSFHEISQSIHFPMNEINGGDTPGVIVMVIEDRLSLDPQRKAMAVFINASTLPQSFENQSFQGRNWKFPEGFDSQVDPYLQQAQWNSQSGRVQIPPRTVLVLEEPQ